MCFLIDFETTKKRSAGPPPNGVILTKRLLKLVLIFL